MIERLYAHNYRCLENFTLDLSDHQSHLVIGKNGAGKSTILACLRLFQSIARGEDRVRNVISEIDFAFDRTDHPMRFEIELRLSGKQYKYSVSFEWPSGFEEARILDEGLAVDGQPVFARELSKIQLSSESTFHLNWHVFALPVINERPGEQAIKSVRDFLATTILTAPMPNVMEGFSDEPSMELQIHAQNFASCLRGLLERNPAVYGIFESHVKDVIADFKTIEHIQRGKRGKQLVVKFEQDQPQRTISLEFDALSQGEKCILLGAYILAANTVGPPVFCMWDEPDSHLSLSEVGHFIISLRKMANKGGQFIATTHHPETLRAFSDESTLVLSRKSHLDPTVVRALSDFDYGGDLISALIRDEIIG